MTGKLKKALLLNLPYLLFAWLFDKLCQAVRLAPGLNASEKLLRIAQGFTEAFASLWLSLHPLDLLLGAAGAALVRLAVYLKAKNAKAAVTASASFREFSAKNLAKEKKPSIRRRLTKAKEQAKRQELERGEKVKNRDRGLER